MQAVILAGGKGSRLGGDVPKPLVGIGGKPLIAHVIDNLPDVIDEVIVVLPFDFIWMGTKDRKCNIKYVTQPTPLGTGDALRWAYPYIRGDFLLLGADTIFQTEDIERVCNGDDVCLACATCTRPVQSVIYSDPPQIIEKHPGSFAGMPQSVMLYKLTPDIFAFLPELQLSSRGEYEVQDAINMLSRDYGPGKVTIIEVGEYHHITTGADVERLNRTLSGVKCTA